MNILKITRLQERETLDLIMTKNQETLIYILFFSMP